jgi:phosphorylase kinase alpha/beta subunit
MASAAPLGILAAMRQQFHNGELERLHRPGPYTVEQVEAIARAFDERATLAVTPLSSGLYPASGAASTGLSGYGNVWVRDNVYVAFAQWKDGRRDAAVGVAKALLAFYGRHRHRFDASVRADADGDVMSRPHVRFDGTTLSEIGERWPHAQNDALGYFLWLCSSLGRSGNLPLQDHDVDTIVRLTDYFRAIRYWEDNDSGHWEETRRISASSIGVVVAGLREWIALLQDRTLPIGTGSSRARLIEAATDLVADGARALDAILPSECTQLAPLQNRRYDAALLFLIYPLGVIDGPIATLILSDVRRYLQGPVGIRRYLGDSYWAPDYDRLVSARDQTRDYSAHIEARDALLEGVGHEAQWCLFDPLLSALHGERYLAHGARADRDAQVFHFNRALAQVTPAWQCPELYFERDGMLVANPHTPLLWTQSNLGLALAALRATARAT